MSKGETRPKGKGFPVDMYFLDDNRLIRRVFLDEKLTKAGNLVRLTFNPETKAITLWVRRIEGGKEGWNYVATSTDEATMRRRYDNLGVDNHARALTPGELKEGSGSTTPSSSGPGDQEGLS